MISFFVLSSLLISAQAIIDTNCTDGTNPTNAAINCNDIYSTTACEKLYTTPTLEIRIFRSGPRIDCSRISLAMCKDPTWREIIAQDCPASCGFCTLGGCVDAAPDCGLNPSVCFINGLEEFSRTNCKRTCGLCDSSSTTSSSATSTASSTTCRDAAANCASWVRNGFCTNTFYSTAEKRRNCGISCGLC
ncbi:unnamed protein product [Auanema sp. JU1783]|nr:unnamed protein product [Auanema sp. JU1783]